MAYTSEHHWFKCNLCGLPVGGCPREWLNEFRALYTRGHRWYEPRVSGIGWAHNTEAAVVPVDADTRYDDESVRPLSMISIFLFRPFWPEDCIVPVAPDPSEPPWQERPWGFLIHASCWKILEAASSQKIDVLTLFTFMRSFPMGALNVLYWCHTYGGIYELQCGSAVTPLENDSLLRYAMLTDSSGSQKSALAVYELDPLAPPLLQEWIRQSVKDSGTCASAPANSANPSDGACDRFARLPLEVRESILCNLSSLDVLQAMLASKAFSSIILSQTFWRSRFARGFEFEFVFEALHRIPSSNQYRDCKYLYHTIYSNRYSRTLANRKRVWYLLQPLADLSAVYSGSSPSGEPLSTVWDSHPQLDIFSWQTVSAHLVDSKRELRIGCRTLFIRQIFLWNHPKQVRASVLNLGSVTYVTGMRFIFRDKSVVELGYLLPNLETIFEEDTDSGSSLSAISVLAGTLGIHAITMFGDGSNHVKWAGSRRDGSERTINIKGAKVIKGHFDGLKLVSIGVRG